jgi:hypothetical protein
LMTLESPDVWSARSVSHARDLIERRLARTGLVMAPLRDSDYQEVYRWSIDPSVSRTWMYRGATPSFEEFMQHLFGSVLAQFIFLRDHRPVAVGALYDANFAAGRAAIRVLVSPEQTHPLTGFDGFALLSRYAFANFPFDKLYMQVNSFSVTQFQRAVDYGYFAEEARLHNYERFGDEWADLVYLSVSRSRLADPKPMTIQIAGHTARAAGQS